MFKTNTLLKLYYNISDLDSEILKISEYLKKQIDYTDSTQLILHREEGRLLLPIASKCHMSVDYYYRLNNKRTGDDYAILASLREYTEMLKKDLENTIVTIHNTLNYFKNERYSN